jgi:prefoldin subunit 5
MSNAVTSLDFLLQASSGEEVNPTGKAVKQAESAKTLESYHTTQISKLREEKEHIDVYKRELQTKKDRLETVEKEFLSPVFVKHTSDLVVLTSRHKLEKEIRELEEKIHRLESGEEETDYFLRVGDILFSYTDAQDRIATGERPMETAKKGRIPANSVYSYFSNHCEDDAAFPTSSSHDSSCSSGAVVRARAPVATTTRAATAAGGAGAAARDAKPTKASDIRSDIGFKRDKALEHYLSALNPDSIQHESSVASSIAEDFGNCPYCDSEMFFNETFLDCPGCGYRDCILVDSEKPSYKDPPREMSYYAYKKINHLNEWLAQFQAKETTEISPQILDLIRAELRKERITDMSKLKPSKLKEVVKKLKLNRCNDHIAHILNRLNGISAPVLSREVEEKLRFMFREIQFSFVKHCPKKRSNFLSYSFVLYKFCELLELDDYLPCFPLLKSREKLYMQDKIWQKICEDMGWQFIRTV